MNSSFIDLDRAQRLKEERKKFAGLTQKQIAEIVGIREQSWIRFEKKGEPFDLRIVDQLSEYGFDMLYVIFGFKKELDSKQSELLRAFNSLDAKNQSKALEMINLLADD